MKALVIGAGIGGLATANALLQAGMEVEIYESSPALRAIGAGISLWTNAVRALSELGFAEALRSRSVGGCQAIEDALVLARMLQTHADVSEALRAYEKQRIARTTPIVQRSRQIGKVGQWQNPWACRTRDWLFSKMPAGLVRREMEAVITYDEHLQCP